MKNTISANPGLVVAASANRPTRSVRHVPLLIALLATLPLGACGDATDHHEGQPVTERRAAFRAILRAFEPMGVQLRDQKYDPDRFIALARELNRVKSGPWTYFGDGSNYPPTRAKASVWTDSDRFFSERQTFLQATDRLFLVADSRDEKKVAAAYDAVADSCRSCHEAFRK